MIIVIALLKMAQEILLELDILILLMETSKQILVATMD